MFRQPERENKSREEQKCKHKKTEQNRRVEDERRLRRHLPDRNLEFPFVVTDTQTHIYKERGKEREREKEQKRENDSVTLPAVDHAKMIIMPKFLQ